MCALAVSGDEPAPGRPDALAAQPDWWSLRPIAIASPPSVAPDNDATKPKALGDSWPRTPIDAFVLAKLHEHGLAPADESDRRTLVRRVFFDLTGLPPSPDDVREFLNDPAPDAYERLVDRLLASPRYGERWARHWMDVVHFGESHGFENDSLRENAWPYRDYLIGAFNRDVPYARFIKEQLAADVFYRDEQALTPALGFIAAGPWDRSSLQEIQAESIDRQIAYYVDRDDMVATAMATFTSLTVQCARCHDHKFDPITQRDYYGLQAVFAGIGRADRRYDPDPAVRAERKTLNDQLAALERRDPSAIEMLRRPEVQADVLRWEEAMQTGAARWTILQPASVQSAGGATLAPQPDSSVLSTGPRPEKDTYTIAADVRLPRVTAVRIEVLTDESLSKKGPGRQDNGNLHLSEFKLTASATLSAADGPGRPIALQSPTADFNQDGWRIEHALDGNPATAWGIYPKVGESHQAVFELKEDLAAADGVRLIFVLEQLHGGGHLIGRLRLAATDAPRPVAATPLSESLVRTLATPFPARTKSEQLELAAFVTKEKLQRQLSALPKLSVVFAGAAEFEPVGGHRPPGEPRPVHVLKRGDIHQPLELAAPGALECVSELRSRFELTNPQDEAARRAALAEWVSDPHNPLTWRSIVNRVWHYHFGRGIVTTPNDFGRMGAAPTHGELLDWLAASFRDSGGSLKQLHRLIVTSAVYRQSSAASQQSSDSDNRYLWRMNRSRLDAESMRDAVLFVAGRLDLAMGGPSVRQFNQSGGTGVTPNLDYAGFDWDSPGAGRRSVYRYLFRSIPDPFMDSFDCADPQQLTAVRNVSITPLQALALLNNEFTLRHSRHFAEQVRSTSADLDRQIAAAYELALARPPSADELTELRPYVTRHGLANLCRLILNSNEFLFVE
jgi:hypothetical protein